MYVTITTITVRDIQNLELYRNSQMCNLQVKEYHNISIFNKIFTSFFVFIEIEYDRENNEMHILYPLL